MLNFGEYMAMMKEDEEKEEAKERKLLVQYRENGDLKRYVQEKEEELLKYLNEFPKYEKGIKDLLLILEKNMLENYLKKIKEIKNKNVICDKDLTEIIEIISGVRAYKLFISK